MRGSRAPADMCGIRVGHRPGGGIAEIFQLCGSTGGPGVIKAAASWVRLDAGPPFIVSAAGAFFRLPVGGGRTFVGELTVLVGPRAGLRAKQSERSRYVFQ